VVGKISLPADYLTDCARNKREDWLNLQIAHGEGKVWSGKFFGQSRIFFYESCFKTTPGRSACLVLIKDGPFWGTGTALQKALVAMHRRNNVSMLTQ
jgi:hypothetical protein